MKILLLIICISFIAPMAYSKNTKNIPESLIFDSSQYLLCKEHTIKYAYIIKIAYVGLYLKDCSNDNNFLNMKDKLIRFNYQLDVKASVFSEAAEKFYLKNISVSQSDLDELKTFNEYYVNISSSDYFDLYHNDEGQLALYKNNTILGTSSNKIFAKNYFNIWFGKYPAVKKLKNSFLNMK